MKQLDIPKHKKTEKEVNDARVEELFVLGDVRVWEKFSM